MRGISRKETPGLRLAGCLMLALIAAVCSHGQTPARLFEVSGVVLDPNGAVIVEARLTLRHEISRSEQTSLTNQRGQFRFIRVASGDYSIEVQKVGFRTTVTPFTVGAQASLPLQIVLPIAELRENSSVDDRSNQISTNPEENLNVIRLDRNAIKRLPILGNDVVGSLLSLLDAGSVGATGPTVIIDGLESSKKKVPASQIQEVRINQNPYSAEFSRPGRGRIEVITKAGSTEYHGELNAVFRDHHFDARNAFATERPPEQRRIFEGTLNGPLGNGKKTSFLFGVNREEEDLQSVVYASTPAGIVSQSVAYPNRDTELSFRVDHQIGDKTTLSMRYEHTFDSAENGGVGGFNLPEVGTNSSGRDDELYLTVRRLISARLINEFTLHVGIERNSSLATHPDTPKTVVLDAFTGGSSQVARRSTLTQIQINEIISWNQGGHFVKAGLNISDISRRGSTDRTNFGGTFTFSTLDDYTNNRPFLFSINQGEPHLVFWQRDFGLFVQDNILVRPNLSIGAGLRYDWQSYLGDQNNFSPRVSIAYAPGKQRKTVLRGGTGIFYDRTGSGPISDTLRFDGQRVRQIVISNPGYPDPFSSGAVLARVPSSIVRFAPDIRSPYTIQSSLGIERQLAKSLTASANYIFTRGIKSFRSRNINAPFPPYTDRPDPSIGVFRQIESAGQARGHALELMLRGRFASFFNGTVQYTLGRAYNDTAGINTLPANSYDLTGEWSRADFDERNRFNFLGTIEAGDWFDLGFTLSLVTGRPYSLTTGRDDNNDTIANDRPEGVPRNSLQGTTAAIFNVRWAKEIVLGKTTKGEGPSITIAVDAFNVLNRTNFSSFVGNLSSPFFGQPVASRPARQMQLTLGFQF